MTEKIQELELRCGRICARLGEQRAEVMGTLAQARSALEVVDRVLDMGRMLSAAKAQLGIVAALGGLWLLLRSRKRHGWWNVALLAWRAWSFWRTISGEAGVLVQRPA